MRKPFIQTLTELAREDSKIVLLIGDVGFSFLENFRDEFPDRFINCGIAEQNMMGFAVGLANMGFKPYVYTMSNFIIIRPLEQVRNDICYSNANVKLFGVKGSEAYKFLGMSHNMYNDEDKKILSTLPNIKTYFPQTEEEATSNILEEYARVGCAYTQI